MAAARSMAKREVQYGSRKECTRCGRKRAISKFRRLASGYLQGMCVDCEREYERERWHNRSAASKAQAGGAALRRRRSSTKSKARSASRKAKAA